MPWRSSRTSGRRNAALAQILLHYDRDWAGAERESRRAVELSPSYPTGHIRHSQCLSALGRHDEAIRAAKRAAELDPLSPIIAALAGRAFYFARQYDRAVELYDTALEIDPSFWVAHLFLGLVHLERGAFGDASSEFELGSGPTVEARSLVGVAHAAAGRRADAQAVLDELVERSRTAYVPRYHIARLCAALGDRDPAFRWLERAFQERDGWIAFLQVEPSLDPLRTDPRFDDLVRRAGLMP